MASNETSEKCIALDQLTKSEDFTEPHKSTTFANFVPNKNGVTDFLKINAIEDDHSDSNYDVGITDEDEDSDDVFADHDNSYQCVGESKDNLALQLEGIPDLMCLDVGSACATNLHVPSILTNCSCAHECCKCQVLLEKEIKTSYKMSFDQLPSELFFYICSFLDAKIVRNILSNVCIRFRILVTDKQFWKNRIFHRWPKPYPAVEDEDFDWSNACEEREEMYNKWSSHESQMNYHSYTTGLYGAVDTVHLIKDGCILGIGCRDNSLHLLNLSCLENNESVSNCLVTNRNAHKGWIWCMSSADSLLASGSWDSYVKFWDIGSEGPREIFKTKCNTAVLCSHLERNILFVGTYGKQVVHIDPWSGSVVQKLSYHQQAVLCLAVNERFIITGSEDKTICLFDRRANLVSSTLKLPSSYPTCMSLFGNELWIGGRDGRLHFIDLSEGNLSSALSYDVGHQHAMTGVIRTLGATFTSSKDRSVKVLEPNLSPGLICEIKKDQSEISKITYENQVLVAAYGEACVGIWRPANP